MESGDLRHLKRVLTSTSERQRDPIDSDKGLALFGVRKFKVPAITPDLDVAA